MTTQRCIDCGEWTSRAGGLRCRPCYFVLMRQRFNDRLAERVWSKIDQRDPAECWPWRGWLSDGYGHIDIGSKTHKAHRVVWSLVNGPIPRGLVVRHACDNPQCCNPAHLLLGTQLDNIRDRVERGRSAKENPAIRGANHWTARRTQAA